MITSSVKRHWRRLLLSATVLTVLAGATGQTARAEGYPYAPSMAPDQQAANTLVRSAYASWKDAYLTTEGTGGGGLKRVKRPQDKGDTVSEGIGYGMLLAAYLEDRETLDSLWAYAKKYRDPQHGLMQWKIGADGVPLDTNAATDGDEDMAIALVVAARKWGGGYGDEALFVIGKLMTSGVNAQTGVLKPGVFGFAADDTNPSYFDPAYYKVFHAVTGDARWLRVAEAAYEVIDQLNSKTGAGTTGLLPEWSKASGDRIQERDPKDFSYDYNACRVPWRLVKDAAWNNDPKARAQLAKLNAFFSGVGAANIRSGYTLSGVPTATYGDLAFIAPAASGAMVSPDAAFRRAMWNETVNRASENYYSDTLRLLALLFMSGNMPDPRTIGPAGATLGATAVVSASPIAPGGGTTIRAGVRAGSAAFSGVVDIEVFDATNNRVGQRFFDQENIPAGQFRTYDYPWTAPDATGVFTVKIGLFAPSWSSVLHWNDAAASITVAAPDTAQYPFENGTQGWAASGGMIAGVASTEARPYRGTRSLAVTFRGGSADTQRVFVASPSVPAGRTITFRVWIPASSAVSALQVYTLQGAAGNWAWTGNWQPISSLRPGAWNTITVPVSANAATPLAQIGVEFFTNGPWSGTCYVDSVGW